MQLYPAYHDNTQKTIVGGVIVPANEGGAADLKAELDTLFNHQNTGPFFCRQLIQRLVTSNPSPGYVYRVAQVFANDGTGTRGNLAAVVKAILLDSGGALARPARQRRLRQAEGAAPAPDRALPRVSTPPTDRRFRFALFNPDQSLGPGGPATRRPSSISSCRILSARAPSPPSRPGRAGVPDHHRLHGDQRDNTYYNSIYTSTTPSASTLVLDLSSLTSAASNATRAAQHAQPAVLRRQHDRGHPGPAEHPHRPGGAAHGADAPSDRARFALELVVTAPDGAVQQ
jgi:hypothetical protein